MTHAALRTERLELVDGRGRVRAVLTCDGEDGAPSLTMRDADGRPRVILGIAWDEMPQIQLTAPDGTARVALVVRPEGEGLVVVADGAQRSTTLRPDETAAPGPPDG